MVSSTEKRTRERLDRAEKLFLGTRREILHGQEVEVRVYAMDCADFLLEHNYLDKTLRKVASTITTKRGSE